MHHRATLAALSAALLAIVIRSPDAHAIEGRTGYIIVNEQPRPRARTPRAGDPPRRIIYLNRTGGTYTGSQSSDSTKNQSSIIDGSYVVPAWDVSGDAWRSIMACSRLMFGRFNVDVTDQDPGNVDHIEALITANSSDVGFGANVGGVSPLACGTGVLERSIVYVFGGTSFNPNPQKVCEVIAQEVAHSMELDHELLCSDPMTYLASCGPQSFQDMDADCHDMNLNKAPCICTGLEKQNSVQMLLAKLGPAEAIPPVVSITSPLPGAVVKPGFVLEFDATDNYIVTKRDLWVDGAFKVGLGNNSRIDIPLDVLPGEHTFEIKAYDPAGNIGTASVTVTIEAECTDSQPCPGGEVCVDAVCKGDLGARCSDAEECASGTCARDDSDAKICTRACGNGCPSGFACEAQGGSPTERCFPSSGDGGGCRVGQRGTMPVTTALLAALAILLATRRRR